MEGFFDFFSELSHRSVQIGLNSIIMGVALALVAWLFVRVVKRLNAATRYSIWWVTLGLIIFLPFMSGPLKGALKTLTVQRAVAAVPEIGATVTVAAGEVVVDPTSERSAEENAALRAAVMPAAAFFEPMPPAEWNRSIDAVRENKSNSSLAAGFVPLGLIGLWMMISSFLLMRLVCALVRLSRVKAASTPLSAETQSWIDTINPSMNLKRSVAVRLSDDVGCPVAAGLGNPMILLPRMLVERLSKRELESIVLHEFAHLARWDDWARLVQKTVEALFFFHPALFWIGRQLDLERELACDDQVISRTGTPADYCRCLTRLLQLAGSERLSLASERLSLAAGALSGRRQIFSRFERLLARRTGQNARLSRPWFTAAVGVIVAALCVCVFAMPVMALPLKAVTFDQVVGPEDEPGDVLSCDEPPCEKSPCDVPPCEEPPCDEPVIVCPKNCPDDVAESEQMAIPPELADTLTELPAGRIVDWSNKIYNLPISFTLRSTDGKARVAVLWCLGDRSLRVVKRGQVTFTPDDRSVESVAPLSFLAISDRRHDERIELEVRAGVEAKPILAFFKNGVAHPIGNAEEQWLSEIVLILIRECGFGADERVARILEERGLPAVLAEIAAIDSDPVQAEYLGALVRMPDLDGEGIGATIRMIGKVIDGNDSKCTLLTALKPRLIAEPDLLTSFAVAFETMEKDYVARRVLTDLGTDPAAGEEIILPVLALSAHLADCGRVKLLHELAPRCATTPALRAAFAEGAETIEKRSDRDSLLDALDDAKRRVGDAKRRVVDAKRRVVDAKKRVAF